MVPEWVDRSRGASLPAAVAIVCALGVAAGLAERGQAAPGPVQLVSIGKFNQPTFVTAPPGDTARVFVVEKQGTVEVLHDGVVSKFLDITSRVTTSGTEQGLLSIAFDPNYATQRAAVRRLHDEEPERRSRDRRVPRDGQRRSTRARARCC